MALALSLSAVSAQAQPTFDKSFQPSTIGPGSTTTLTFTIDNSGGGDGVADLAFTDVFPAGVRVADLPRASTTCQGEGSDGRPGSIATITAAPGAGTVSVTGGSVRAGASCVVQVDVTSSAPGTHTNVSGDLTSDAGNSGPATADLVVDSTRPGFSKAFAPAQVNLGQRSRLTFTLDNSANPALRSSGQFQDILPSGLVVADPVALATDCLGASVVALEGGNSIQVTSVGLMAGATCTVALDVVPTAVGTFENVSGEFTSVDVFSLESSGFASAELDVLQNTLSLTASFEGDPVAPGETVALAFTLRNQSRFDTASGVTFTDDLDAALAGLVAVGTPQSGVCGAGSTLSGTSALTLSGATLAPEASCSFSVDVAVPAGAASGSYTNMTSAVTGQVGGSAVTSAPASDDLFVSFAPTFSKTFLDDPVAPGGQTTLEFTIQNTSPTASLTDLSFSDPLLSVFPSASLTLPASNFCGPGSVAVSAEPTPGQPGVMVAGGSLAAGASCTFEVGLDLPAGTTGGGYISTTSELTGALDGELVTAAGASASVAVVPAPELTAEFVDDPVVPGGTATLAFTLTYADAESGVGPASDIAFSTDLTSSGLALAASGTPTLTGCGAGATLTGSQTLTFANGALVAGETCTVTVPVSVPTGATSGASTVTSSTVTATAEGLAVEGLASDATLVVAALSFTKAFIDDPVAPGGTVTLEFSFENLGAAAAADIAFTDNLTSVLSGLTATGLPASGVCGAGSQFFGTTTLIFTGGSLDPGASCTFSVVLQVPGGAAANTYGNVTSAVSATIGGQPATIPAASAPLVVALEQPPTFAKAFAPSQIATGGVSTLTLTIDNSANDEAATALDVTDNLPAGLTLATPAAASTTCTGGTLTAVDGAGTLSYSGGSVGAGTSCTVSVDVTAVPAGDYVNTTGALTSSLGDSGTASATLSVRDVDIVATKTDAILSDDGDGLADPGEAIRYTVTVSGTGADIPDVQFTDVLGSAFDLVVGSVTTSAGTVVSGNTAGDTDVAVDLGTLGSGRGETVITFDALVSLGLPSATTSVCNQGLVADAFPTDDLATPAADDATCTPVAPDPVASFSAPTYTGVEGGSADVIVSLDEPARGRESATVTLTAGDATDLDGFTSETVTFADGETSASVTISIPEDGEAEGAETFTLALQSPDFLTLGTPSETELIVVPSAVSASFTAVQQGAGEGDGTVTLTLTLSDTLPRDAQGTVTLVQGDPADLGGFESATISFESGAGAPQTYAVEVPITDDGLAEETESFTFRFDVAEADREVLVAGSPAQTVVAIADNDGSAIVVTVPPVDADGDGAEDGGARLLSLPVGGLTVGELADAAGADRVYWFRAGLAPVEAPDGAVLFAGEPVLLDVAAGAEIAVSGTPLGEGSTRTWAGVGVSTDDGDAPDRYLVPVGNPAEAPLALDAFAIDGGTLADVALVLDPALGAFRPVSLSGLDAGDALVLDPFSAVVLQVVPESDAPGVTVSTTATGAASGTSLAGAPFVPRDGETALGVTLRQDAAGGRLADTPGDLAVVRVLPSGEAGLDRFDGFDVPSPLGATLAALAPDAPGAALAALAQGPLPTGAAVTVPLSIAVPEAGAYAIAYRALADAATGPVAVEVLDRGVPTALAEGEAFSFTASAAEAGDPNAFDGRFALRVSKQGGVATNPGPEGLAVGVYPNPASGLSTVSVSGAGAGRLRIALYDALGREAVVVHDGPATGTFEAQVRTARLAPGVYILRVDGPGVTETRSVTVVR